MVRKYKKTSLLKEYRLDQELEGHLFAYGRIGAGKSVSLLSVIQGYHDIRHYKVFDLYGGDRHEGVYWTIPNQDKYYWAKFNAWGQMDEEGPKQYRVNLLYPYFESKMPKKLPTKVINGERVIKSIPFQIPLKDIAEEDVKMVLGNISDTNKYILTEILHATKKTDNAGCLNYLIKKYKGTSGALYRNFLLPMSREKFLSSKDSEFNIDLVEQARDKEVISVLCLEFVPPQFHLFIINYFIRKLIEHIESGKIPKKNLLFMREAATFFRATDESVQEDRYKIFRTAMSHYIRMGRRGTFFCLSDDTKIKYYKNNKLKNSKIKNLPNKFIVKSYNFDKNKFEKNIAYKQYNGEKECYEIELENNKKVIATKEHKFFDKNNNEIEVEKLKLGDEILIENGIK